MAMRHLHLLVFLIERLAPLRRLVDKFTAWCKKTLPLFEFPALAAAWQTDQPMHSQSANFGKFKLNSLNLAGFFSLHPVVCGTFHTPLFAAICGRIPKPFQPWLAMITWFYLPYELHWSKGYYLEKWHISVFVIFLFATFLLLTVWSQVPN